MVVSFIRKTIGSHLGTKSIIAVILLLSTISIALTSFFVGRQKSSLTEELRKRAYSLSSNLAFNSQYAVLSEDKETLDKFVSGVIKESDIKGATITNLNGFVLSSNDSLIIGKRIPFYNELDTLVTPKWLPTEKNNIWRTITLIEIERKPAGNDELVLFLTPERTDSTGFSSNGGTYTEKLGYAILEVSLESMNEILSEDTRLAVMITLVLIFAGALAAVYLVRNIAVPIKRLVEVTKAVAEDDLDQNVPIERTDEIGILANSFNDMIRQLKVSRDRIEAWNRLLEKKVTERTKELEEKHAELEQAYEALKTLDKAKDDFLSLVSHELRTPLSSVLLYSEMLLDGLAESEQTQKEFLSTIVGNCKRLTRLINDVLDLSKIEAGRMPFTFEELNCKKLAADTIISLRPTLDNKKIRFDYENIDENIKLWGDRDKVIQVLTNIISNAIKFTPAEGKISISLTNYDKKMGLISISDTGKGIKKEDIHKVFDRFTQLESIDHHSQGSGLGMTISKSIVERLGGKIWIESEIDQGTTVFFTLPKWASNINETIQEVYKDGSQPQYYIDS